MVNGIFQHQLTLSKEIKIVAAKEINKECNIIFLNNSISIFYIIYTNRI